MRLLKNGESKSGKAPEVKGIKRGEAPKNNRVFKRDKSP